MKHTCSLCGTELIFYTIPILHSSQYAYGCPKCSMMIQGQILTDIIEGHEEEFKEHQYKEWIEAFNKDWHVHTVRTENVLRAAYGMDEVDYGLVCSRDAIRYFASRGMTDWELELKKKRLKKVPTQQI